MCLAPQVQLRAGKGSALCLGAACLLVPGNWRSCICGSHLLAVREATDQRAAYMCSQAVFRTQKWWFPLPSTFCVLYQFCLVTNSNPEPQRERNSGKGSSRSPRLLMRNCLGRRSVCCVPNLPHGRFPTPLAMLGWGILQENHRAWWVLPGTWGRRNWMSARGRLRRDVWLPITGTGLLGTVC